ncbi:MAG: hypothetical protein JNM18_22590 [Planctomycetaceae bacterium]|nr:hypothetical protein [Planctomycetaceae bacterium]
MGEGVFLEALKAQGVPREHITAVDLAKEEHHNDELAVTARGVDFLHWSGLEPRRFDRVVGNPPYVPFDELSAPALAVARTVAVGPERGSFGGRANLWAAFVAASVSKLAHGGSFGFVLPAAWDYADYAAPLRLWLPKQFREFRVLRCREPLFESVEEGAVVLLGLGYGQSHTSMRRIETGSLDDMIAAVRCPPAAEVQPHPAVIRPMEGLCLSELMEIRIGAVTGDTNYFVLSELTRKSLALPESALMPVLSKAAHVRIPFVTRKHWSRLRAANERIWLFRPREADVLDGAVARYLRLEPRKGGCHRNRGKVKGRTPWFQTLLPPAPHGFISGMTSAGPWLALNQMRGLSATNTLYTVRFKPRANPRMRVLIALALLTTTVRRQVAEVIRRYPGGLVKLEPGDLNQLRLPPLASRLPRSCLEVRYTEALRMIQMGRETDAQAIADSILSL